MADLWYALVAFTLTAYVVLDGYDFGAGMLHLLIARSEDDRPRACGSRGAGASALRGLTDRCRSGKVRVDAEVPSQCFLKPAQSTIWQMPEIPNFYVAILKIIGDSIRKDMLSGN